MKKINRVPKTSLMKIVEEIANNNYGGHYTIFSFTHQVKFCFGTVTDREGIFEMSSYDDINDAIENELQRHMCLKETVKDLK
jgi:hypothetical protein